MRKLKMTVDSGEVVLVTGGSGFIGQHIIKQLIEQQEQLGIREIRSVDIVPYQNVIGHTETSYLKTFVGDICQPQSVEKVFKGVDSVFHCAAYISIQYPPNNEELERVNVGGTRAVVELCVKHSIKRLIYTSCASVCMVPFKGHSTFTIIINQTESKATTPKYDAHNLESFEKSFLIPGYSASKLRAEMIVLNSNEASLANQKDLLSTVAIRPTLTYGEGDTHFMPKVFEYLEKHSYTYPRVAGAGGKQQLVYAGNVAWGHICAYKTLKSNSKAIAGLPVFITDDTPIHDVCRFIQKTAVSGEKFKVNLSFWYLPHFLFFFLSFLTEFLLKLLYPLTKYRLKYSLRAIASFTASVLMFNRLRASIHIDYTPLIDSDTAMQRSARWYIKWWEENLAKSSSKSAVKRK